MGAQCAKLEKEWGAKAHRIFYMATPPSMFGEIPKYLGKAGLARDREWARIVVEKPIGYDLESARALNAILAANFEESQIFRIDHYLGKETVQNILAFRFANPLFEPIWNRRYIDYVTITVAEAVGVEHRGGYYDHAGALRDMVQNHLMQLLCLVAMEPMVSFEADEIRNKKVDVLHAARPIHRDAVRQCAVRGQYGPGNSDGKKVPGYREEDGRGARFPNGDVCGAEAVSRQLALAGRAVLPAHGQAPAPAGLGNFHPISRGAASVVSGRGLARLAAVPAGHVDPAR